MKSFQGSPPRLPLTVDTTHSYINHFSHHFIIGRKILENYQHFHSLLHKPFLPSFHHWQKNTRKHFNIFLNPVFLCNKEFSRTCNLYLVFLCLHYLLCAFHKIEQIIRHEYLITIHYFDRISCNTITALSGYPCISFSLFVFWSLK